MAVGLNIRAKHPTLIPPRKGEGVDCEFGVYPPNALSRMLSGFIWIEKPGSLGGM